MPSGDPQPRRAVAAKLAAANRPLLPERRSVPVRPPMVRGPGYRISSANRLAPCYTIGKRIELGRDLDPLLADDYPGPARYDTSFGMADRPRGPSYSMSARLKVSANTDPLIPDDTPGPGQYDTTKY